MYKKNNEIMEFDSSSTESAKEPPIPVESIPSTAFENRIKDQMIKGNVVFDSTLTSINASDSTIITSTEASSQKSPPKINNA